MNTITSVSPTSSSMTQQTVQGWNQARNLRMLQQVATTLGINPLALQDAYQSGRTPRDRAASLLSAVADQVQARPDALQLAFQQARLRASTYRSYYQPRTAQSSGTLSALVQSNAARTSSAISSTPDSGTSTSSTSAILNAGLPTLGSIVDIMA